MVNGKLWLKGKNMRILVWVMIDGKLQLIILNAVKICSQYTKTKRSVSISKRSVSLPHSHSELKSSEHGPPEKRIYWGHMDAYCTGWRQTEQDAQMTDVRCVWMLVKLYRALVMWTLHEGVLLSLLWNQCTIHAYVRFPNHFCLRG